MNLFQQKLVKKVNEKEARYQVRMSIDNKIHFSAPEMKGECICFN